MQTEPFTETYWGKIKTVCNDWGFTAKVIVMNPNTQSSMEYHIKKHEVYYVQSGQLIVTTRTGRAEDKDTLVKAGEVFSVSAGMMHQRKTLEGCEIFEVSTTDLPGDTYFVVDGKTLGPYRPNEEA